MMALSYAIMYADDVTSIDECFHFVENTRSSPPHDNALAVKLSTHLGPEKERDLMTGWLKHSGSKPSQRAKPT